MEIVVMKKGNSFFIARKGGLEGDIIDTVVAKSKEDVRNVVFTYESKGTVHLDASLQRYL